MTIETETMARAKWALVDAIYKAATAAAEFEASANNYDRPISETPWLAARRYGDGEYDARWYAVMSARDHFHGGLVGRIENELAAYAAVAFMAGMDAS